MLKNKLFIGSFLAILLLIVVEFLIYNTYIFGDKRIVNISFIVCDDTLTNWESMKSGAAACSNDYDSSVIFLNSSKDAGAQGQIDLIKSQLDAGTDYVVVVPYDYEEIANYIIDNDLEKRVVIVRNGAKNKKLKSVLADEKLLGSDLAEYIAEHSDCKNLVLLTHQNDLDKEQLIVGLDETLADSGINLNIKYYEDYSKENDLIFYNYIASGMYDGIVTLDEKSIDNAVAAKDNISSEIPIYSLDNRPIAVYYLEKNQINALAFKDDYTMGFLAVDMLMNPKNHTNTDGLYYIVDKENMYLEQNQKVLFPFAK
ncbi:MAG: substrate-binding domain-containing protein [Pseudobutyrivibrio sp.]|nr:substrate-binding domain-containing protein [Pseudobutyrivibrio sp.]